MGLAGDIKALLLLGLCSGAVSCGGSSSALTTVQKDDVLARVDGEVITSTDLALAMKLSLGDQAGALDEQGRHKLLQSLVLTTVIAQHQIKKLNSDELAALEREARMHQQRRLVELFLTEQGATEPIGDQRIRDYYEGHLRRFGAVTSQRYEMLSTSRVVEGTARAALITALSAAARESDWDAVATRLRARKLPVQRRSGLFRPGLYGASLDKLIAKLDPGGPGTLTFARGRPFLVRVLSREQVGPRAIEEVAGEIRAALSARARSEALAKVSETLMPSAKVEYVRAPK